MSIFKTNDSTATHAFLSDFYSFGLQFAVAAGAIVIATSSSDEKLKIASKLGAKHVINYNTTPNWDDEILKIVRFNIFFMTSLLTSIEYFIDQWCRCQSCH